MKFRSIRSLLLLNGALLALLVAVSLTPSLWAQSRARGSYVMAAGNAKNAEAAVLYIVDEINQELVAILWDVNARQMTGMGYRDLAADSVNRQNRN